MGSTMLKALQISVLVVALLGIAGVVNYRRNAYLDAELEQRPYGGLSDAELTLLIEAHQQEKSQIEARLGSVANRRDPMRGYADGDLSGKLEGFARVQKNARDWKSTRSNMLDHEVEIERLQHEQSIRARGLDDPWNRILRRVTTL